MTSPRRAHAATPSTLADPRADIALALHPHAGGERDAAERLIREAYARRYGAWITSFAPVLATLRRGDDLLAAAGYRPAERGPLFLETYLDTPVEALIAKQAGHAVARDGVVEVGNLAAPQGGDGRRLIALLAAHLADEGFDWVTLTATRELRAMLARLQAAPLVLGPAHAAALGEQALHWGSYYEHEPVVVAIDLRGALARHRARAPGRDEA